METTFTITTASGHQYQYTGTFESLQRHLALQEPGWLAIENRGNTEA